jgi:MFS family permease
VRYPEANLNISLFSFLIIAIGSLSCVASGYLSQKFGAKRVATIALSLSCVCCIVSPLFLFANAMAAFVIFLFIWSIAVIADSPLFSTLIAQNAPVGAKGSSLTIVNSVGFAITIVSIQLVTALRTSANAQYVYVWLAVGPVLGLVRKGNRK